MGGDFWAECVRDLPVYQCHYTFWEKSAQSMVLMPDARCSFDDQKTVSFPTVYAEPVVGKFPTKFAGDKGYAWMRWDPVGPSATMVP